MKILLILFVFISYLMSNTKNVLLIHSYHDDYKWSKDISLAIKKKFQKNQNIITTTVYMDTKKVSSYEYLKELAYLYKEQFKNRNFDLIISIDNNAFAFIIENYDYLFHGIPILFCGVNNFDRVFLEENNVKNNISGVVEQVDIEKNLNLILNLHPQLDNLIVINDYSRTGQAIRRNLRSIRPKFKNKIKNIEHLEITNIEKLKKKIKKATKKTVILFVGLSQENTNGFLTDKQVLNEIKSVTDAPIYGLWDSYLKDGIIGGLLTSATAQGEAVGSMALEILAGKDIMSIPILEDNPNRYIFDYNELKRHNIKIENHINNYTIVNEPFSFYQEYRNLVNVVLFVFFILILFLILMKRNINMRKAIEIDLSNQVKLNEVLLNTLPNPIYYKDIDGKFLGCNSAFATLIGYDKQNIIGKTAFDFFSKNIADKNFEIDKKLLKDLGTNISELTLRPKDGKMKHFTLSKAVYQNKDGKIGGIVCIMDDTTERIQQKQLLIQNSKLAEMGEMIAAISHQWNEPLVGLSAHIQDIELSYMLNELKNDDIEAFVQESMIQIKYMSKTLQDFRNFLKPSNKKISFNVKESLDEILEIIGKHMLYSNINLKINYEHKDNDVFIYGYKNEFKQVMMNLISNAKNKIVSSAINNKGNIIIKIFTIKKSTIVEVLDDGDAISENIIDFIFDPYFTTKKDGTGIGLYMTRVIIEDKMSGKIDVENRNKNVVFTIKLPNIKIKEPKK